VETSGPSIAITNLTIATVNQSAIKILEFNELELMRLVLVEGCEHVLSMIVSASFNKVEVVDCFEFFLIEKIVFVNVIRCEVSSG
jgi:hypothetical protein